MDKNKMFPIIVGVVLVICAIGIFSWNKARNKSLYSKMIVTFQEKEDVYDNLNLDTSFSLKDVNFYVSAVQKDLIVLTTDSYVTVNLASSYEFQIKVNEFVNVCFNDGECADIRLA